MSGPSRVLDIADKLTALDPRALDMLGVLALVNTWTDRPSWTKLASARGVRGPGGKRLHKSQVQVFIDGFIEAELVTGALFRDNSHRYRIRTPTTQAVLQQLYDSGRLAKLDGRVSPGWDNSKRIRRDWPSPEQLETDLRIASLERSPSSIARVIASAKSHLYRSDLGKWLVLSLGPSAPLAALDCFADEHRVMYLRTLVDFARSIFDPMADHLIDAALALDDKKLRLDVGRLLILRGEPARALALDPLPKYGHEGLALLAALFREGSDYAEVARLGEEVIASMKTRKRKALPELEGLCHVIAGLASSGGDPKRLEPLAPIIELGCAGKIGEPMPHQFAASICDGLLGRRGDLVPIASVRMDADDSWTSPLVRALHDVWLDLRFEAGKTEAVGDARGRAIAVLDAWAKRARVNGFAPVAREFEALAMAYADEPEQVESGAPTLATALRAPEPWQTVLAGLDAVIERAQAVPDDAIEQKSREVVWELRLSARGIGLTPRVRSTRGKSKTKGKRARLETLLEADDLHMTAADRSLAQALDSERALTRSGWRRDPSALAETRPHALATLIGHPRVIDETGRAIQVERGVPTLRTREVSGRLRVELQPAELVQRPLCWRQLETDHGNTLILYERSEALAQAVEIIGAGLDVPVAATDRLARTLARLSVTTGVAIDGDLELETEAVESDPRPVLLLSWDGQQLSVDARVAPLGLDGPRFPAGVGSPAISTELDGHATTRLLRCERDLVEERRRALELERSAPTLAAYATDPRRWSVPSLVDALEVLLELGRLGDTVVLAWLQGTPLRPPIERDLSNLRLAVSSSRGDWLELDAQLELDEGLVVGFRELIEQREGPRFVALGEGRFLALSEQLRRRVDALDKLGARDKTGRVRTSAAMLPVVEELSDALADASFDSDALARLERARELANARPRRPRGFAAKLRGYQREGYEWMWRLAEAGLGACLADDMGLGKTVQALALLAQRAGKGPALVVCPTSVVHNWLAETARFAPNLRAAVLADAPDRAQLLAACEARDLIVCSYGLLVSEAETLAAVEFVSVVFDEAHALKNERTKRARAARELSASFRLGLTGTPIENQVGELWSLFRVLVPGLLGTRKHFDARFAKPIERGEREAATGLRTLLKHFILRRTKAQVLDELPPRTEVTLEIEPTAKARAYYEALRRRALESIDGGDDRNKRFRILAEITRLRQAAVDPRLLDEHGAPAGAKIDALVEQVLALREQGHRALVFTQFLTSMALLRAGFEAAGVEYLEFDGSTSAAERARRVEAFQAGTGDVFILSLRAGGVGLNLTSADYVLHLDPWWNPAVEDQATDRAHRIGQTRPVTVYRLVSKGTIEEKILALHADKRGLADDLLAGMEGAGVLDLDELVGLLA